MSVATPDAIALSIIIPTLGRRTLRRTLRTIASQDTFADDIEVLVVGDGPRPAARAQFEAEAAAHQNWVYLEHGPEPGWGHSQRMAALSRARGRYVMFINDDDGYAPGALAVIRTAMDEHPGRIVIFKMDRIGILYWRRAELRPGDVSALPSQRQTMYNWRRGSNPVSKAGRRQPTSSELESITHRPPW